MIEEFKIPVCQHNMLSGIKVSIKTLCICFVILFENHLNQIGKCNVFLYFWQSKICVEPSSIPFLFAVNNIYLISQKVSFLTCSIFRKLF